MAPTPSYTEGDIQNALAELEKGVSVAVSMVPNPLNMHTTMNSVLALFKRNNLSYGSFARRLLDMPQPTRKYEQLRTEFSYKPATINPLGNDGPATLSSVIRQSKRS